MSARLSGSWWKILLTVLFCGGGLEHCTDNPWRSVLMPPDWPRESFYPLIPVAELALLPGNTIINELSRPIGAEASFPNLHHPHRSTPVGARFMEVRRQLGKCVILTSGVGVGGGGLRLNCDATSLQRVWKPPPPLAWQHPLSVITLITPYFTSPTMCYI